MKKIATVWKKVWYTCIYLREGKCYFRVWNKFELFICVKKRYAIPFMFKSIRHPNPSYELPTPVYMILYSSLSVVHSYQWGTPIQYMHCPLQSMNRLLQYLRCFTIVYQLSTPVYQILHSSLWRVFSSPLIVYSNLRYLSPVYKLSTPVYYISQSSL